MEKINFMFKHLDDAEKEGFYSHFEKKKTKIEKMLQRIPEENRNFEVKVEKFEHKHHFTVVMRLHAPKDDVYVSEDDHDLMVACDKAVDTMQRRLRDIHEKKSKHGN